MHALVADGQVIRTGLLPQTCRLPCGRVVSGFPAADEATHALAGWLPLVDDRPPLTDGQTWGPPSYVIDATHVTVTATVLDAPSPDPTAGHVQDALDAAAAGSWSSAIEHLAAAISPQEDP